MTPDVISLVSGRIRELRLSGGWSQESFAEHAGIERAYYGRVETGKINLTIRTLHKIALGLGQPLEALVAGEQMPVSPPSGLPPRIARREAGPSTGELIQASPRARTAPESRSQLVHTANASQLPARSFG